MAYQDWPLERRPESLVERIRAAQQACLPGTVEHATRTLKMMGGPFAAIAGLVGFFRFGDDKSFGKTLSEKPSGHVAKVDPTVFEKSMRALESKGGVFDWLADSARVLFHKHRS